MYVYYLTCGFISSTRAYNLPNRAFNLATHAFSLLTRGSELVTREFELVTRGFELVTREFEVLTRGFELVTCEFEFVTRGFDLVTRGSQLVTRNSCFTFSLEIPPDKYLNFVINSQDKIKNILKTLHDKESLTDMLYNNILPVGCRPGILYGKLRYANKCH